MNINATLLGQAIAFMLFVWFCMKYVWPPLMDAIEARQKLIAKGLTQAERAEKDLGLARVKIADDIKEAKAEAAVIIYQANNRAIQIVENAKLEAEAARNKIIQQGAYEVEAERKKAREELRLELSELVIAGAEKIIKRSIDKTANSDIIDDLLADA